MLSGNAITDPFCYIFIEAAALRLFLDPGGALGQLRHTLDAEAKQCSVRN